ncbi:MULTISPECIES: urease accessory protein UreF [unclassified Roseovarius]|uniref:urease accessory protein UreF n=1 Tax=unclassified Roseovarius TaxID=2614913 RepID=UPI00273E2B46|nr:urease accessory UreF family protein [Roseovarius sp. MMSF_3350]
MRTDAWLLTLAQWLSPAYPIGAFAWSHGIEQAVRDGQITDADTLQAWLRTCLSEGAGRTDAIWLRLAAGPGDVNEIDAQLRAFAPSAERLSETVRQGAAFVYTTNAVWGLELPQLALPVATGRAAHLMKLDIDACVLLYLQSFVSNLVSAALRLMPLGQTEGQRVLTALQDDILRVEEETRGADLNDIFSNAFLSDIASMRHETLEPRLFQS